MYLCLAYWGLKLLIKQVIFTPDNSLTRQSLNDHMLERLQERTPVEKIVIPFIIRTRYLCIMMK